MEEPTKILSSKELSSNGGKKRAANLTPQRRSEIARIAGSHKGKRDLPKSTHDGCITIGEKKIDCWVVKDKNGNNIRVISSASIRNALGLSNPDADSRKKAREEEIPTFLASNALKPYLGSLFEERGVLLHFVCHDLC